MTIMPPPAIDRPDQAAHPGAADLLCFGEPMMELAEIAADGGSSMRMGFGGDTSNVAVAAARQGLRTGMVTAVGDDAFGERFFGLWDREGIDRRHVTRPAASRTGLYFITYEAAGHVFSYARDGSAASRFTPSDLPHAAIAAARIFHASGISQGIGIGPCDATFVAMQVARDAGVLVSYDTNLRLKLWPLDRARAIIHAAAAMADILRPGLDDARLLTGRDHPDDVVDFYLKLGPKIVALTLGADGCLVATSAHRRRFAGMAVEFVDAAGAGDTFTGAFLAEFLRTGDEVAAALYANVAAALQTRGIGAIDPIPHRPVVEAALATASS